MKIAPCKDCKERYVGCHDHCNKYQSWHKEREEMKYHERINKVYVSKSWGYIPRKRKK